MSKPLSILSTLLPIALAGLLAFAFCGCGSPSHYEVDRKAFPVKGIDVSAHNGSIDFAKAKADSIEFAYIKATEGTQFCDARFSQNFDGAQAAGIKASAYHFFRFDEPGHLQAYHFLTALTDKKLDMPIAIDVEDWQNAKGVPDETVVEELSSMINVIRATGHRMVIYTNKAGYENYIKGNFDDIPLWVCTFGEVPAHLYWRFWQHSHQGKVDGISGPVDLNTFNGTLQQFEDWRK